MTVRWINVLADRRVWGITSILVEICCPLGQPIGSECANSVPKQQKALSVRIRAFCFSLYYQLDSWLRG